jgi:Protein of unknown function (DUF4238)
MAKTHKRQHTIPRVYLSSWVEPYTPPGQTAAINIITKETGVVRRKSPEKSFTENDHYTVYLKDGTRDLSVENHLGRIESDFQGVLHALREGKPLFVSHRAKLAVFTAAMIGRSKPEGDWNRNQLQPLMDLFDKVEEVEGGPTPDGEEMRDLLNNHPAFFVTATMEAAAPVLFRMNLTILTTDDPIGFITCDSPAVMFNPQAYKFPPYYRSLGLGMIDIEVTLPLTPRHMAVYTHFPRTGSYYKLEEQFVDEMNRRTWFHAAQEVVSKTGQVKEVWSAVRTGPEPDDAWKPNNNPVPEVDVLRGSREVTDQAQLAHVAHEYWMRRIFLPKEVFSLEDR